MKFHQPLRIEAQVRAAAHHLPLLAGKTPEAKAKLPHQKALLALHQAIADHEMRLIERLIHMLEDALDLRQAAHLVEGILEVGLRRIELTQARQVAGLQLLKEPNDGLHPCIDIGRHQPRPLTMRRSSGRYSA